MKTKILYENEIDLIDTGTFIHFNQTEPVTISITEDDNTEINIRLEFNCDEKIEKEGFVFSQYNSDTLKILVNHKGQLLNYGYVRPVKIGAFNGFELFINIRIDINSSGDSPLINYTWFKGKKINE